MLLAAAGGCCQRSGPGQALSQHGNLKATKFQCEAHAWNSSGYNCTGTRDSVPMTSVCKVGGPASPHPPPPPRPQPPPHVPSPHPLPKTKVSTHSFLSEVKGYYSRVTNKGGRKMQEGAHMMDGKGKRSALARSFSGVLGFPWRSAIS